MAANNVQYWPIFLLNGGEHVGCGGLRPYRVEEQVYEIGFHLRPRYWRHGLGEEAARAVIAFTFGDVGAKALLAGHHPANSASRRILNKLGFRYPHDEPYPPTGSKSPFLPADPAVNHDLRPTTHHLPPPQLSQFPYRFAATVL